MKIVLFDAVGDIGVVTGWKTMILDNSLTFEVDRDGTLTIGDRNYEVINGIAYVPEYTIVLGNIYGITFTDLQTARKFSCGTISRTGSRMMKITNPIEPCIVACCKMIDEQQERIKNLEKTVDLIKKQYGITII